MNDQSPPKRITRARAAATTTDTGVKMTKIATAASKAKAIRSMSTTKRKTRADDIVDDEEDELNGQIIEPEAAKPRGRPKRAAATQSLPEPEAELKQQAPTAAKLTRGRQKKIAVDPPVAEPVRPKKAAIDPPAASEPARSLRGRPRKVEVAEESIVVMNEPPKKSARGRAATLSKATIPKKSVKFEEPDKENVVPIISGAKCKAKLAEELTGLKAKPVRKTGVTVGRATRGRPKVEESKSSPLSPKKATQVSAPRDQSDDELATTEKTPMRALMKSPIKAPGSVFGTAKKLDFTNSITVNRVVTQDHSASIMRSPARRPPQSPFKDGMKLSPQKVNPGNMLLKSPFKFSVPSQKSAEGSSLFKASMLQSPARRPQSPIKVMDNGSPTRSGISTFAVTPKASTFKISRFTTTPRTLIKTPSRPGRLPPPTTDSKLPAVGLENNENNDVFTTHETEAPTLSFSGRLSSIMPREVDSAVPTAEMISEEGEGQIVLQPEQTVETITVDGTTTADNMKFDVKTLDSPVQINMAASAFRQTRDNPFEDSDSEDELASDSPTFSPAPSGFRPLSPVTPTAIAAIAKTPRTAAAIRFAKSQQIGFTPLAKQLSDWMAASPEKSECGSSDSDELADASETKSANQEAAAIPSPAKSCFFDDEMSIREEMVVEPVEEEDEDTILGSVGFAPVELDEDDLHLAQEADELSILEPEDIQGFQTGLEFLNTDPPQDEADEQLYMLEATDLEQVQVLAPAVELDHNLPSVVTHVQPQLKETSVMTDIGLLEAEALEIINLGVEATPEAALSEASQEYDDENEMNIDPELLVLPQTGTPKYATPKRVLAERVFHTVSKIPLKAAADDTPMRPITVKRSASNSRITAERPSHTLNRNNTVISYSPSRKNPSIADVGDIIMENTPATPSKSDAELWSTIATPARTPRRDLNTSLLKGAVVFVDVHTSEGADASLIFTELLTQMGARCVKSWNWNGNIEDGSKIGITHVVFKDGGKRTLEKSRATGGVVSCVGVGWVLE